MTLATASIAAITASITDNLDQAVKTDSNVTFGVITSGDINSSGTITATEIHTTFVSSSITVASGSNTFGDSTDDHHSFTGSLSVSSSLAVTGSATVVGTLTADEIGAFTAAGAIDFGDQNMTNVDIDSGDITGITFGTAASTTISGSTTAVSSSIATRFDSRETDMTLATASIAAITSSIGGIVGGHALLISGSVLSTGSFGHGYFAGDVFIGDNNTLAMDGTWSAGQERYFYGDSVSGNFVGAGKYIRWDYDNNDPCGTNIHDNNSVGIVTNGTTALTINSSQNTTFGGDVIIDVAGNALLKIDGGEANYSTIRLDQLGAKRWEILNHPTGDILKFNSAAGDDKMKLDQDGGLTIADNMMIASTKNLYFDGGSNTYITEASGDTMAFYTGGNNTMTLDDHLKLTGTASASIFHTVQAGHGGAGTSSFSGVTGMGILQYRNVSGNNAQFGSKWYYKSVGNAPVVLNDMNGSGGAAGVSTNYGVQFATGTYGDSHVHAYNTTGTLTMVLVRFMG
jgi:hypothetical protein